ncbi:MAG: hypothetical protein Q9163_001841 [Psora crenata]
MPTHYSCQNTMAQRGAHEIINHRILDLKTLLFLSLTPLLREQIRAAISLHSKALDAAETGPFIDDLNALYGQVADHWKKINQNITVAASLKQSMLTFQAFLVSKLLEDYANEPYRLDPGMRTIVECVVEQTDHSRQANEGEGGTSYAQGYYKSFIFPLEEMILNREHVEKKLRAAAERQGNPGSDIEPLVKRCDWPDLAATLVYDRELANRLFHARAYRFAEHDTVIQGIDRMQKRYFAELKSATEFTINTRAHGLFNQHHSELSTENPLTWLQGVLTGRKQKMPSPESEVSPLLYGTEEPSVSLKKVE